VHFIVDIKPENTVGWFAIDNLRVDAELTRSGGVQHVRVDSGQKYYPNDIGFDANGGHHELDDRRVPYLRMVIGMILRQALLSGCNHDSAFLYCCFRQSISHANSHLQMVVTKTRTYTFQFFSYEQNVVCSTQKASSHCYPNKV